jgi:hypothetical protein
MKAKKASATTSAPAELFILQTLTMSPPTTPILPLLLLLLLVLLETTSAEALDDEENCVCPILQRPNLRHKEETARWMVHSLDWGVLSTISTRLDTGISPFGNVYSFVDGPCDNSTGIPYFYGTYMDQSFQDSIENPQISLTLSEATFATACGGYNLNSCRISPNTYGDPENPVCARLTLSGRLEIIQEPDELEFATQALFQRHSSMSEWPTDHEWVVAKMVLQDIWLIDYFGGASILNVAKYLEVRLA